MDNYSQRKIIDRIRRDKLVWNRNNYYPCNSQQLERAVLGVKKLTEYVQAEFIIGQDTDETLSCSSIIKAITESFARDFSEQSWNSWRDPSMGCQAPKGKACLLPIRAFPRSPLPGRLGGAIESLASRPSMVTQHNVMALWSKTHKKLYCLDDKNPILASSLSRKEFHVQLATTISLGLLPENPSLTNDLTEFLIGLLACKFEQLHVECELGRKNAKLHDDEELFLEQLPIQSM